MKIARIIARAQIIGIEDDLGLEALNGIFKSPFHKFEEDKSDMQIFEYLENVYKVEIDKIHSSKLDLDYKIS